MRVKLIITILVVGLLSAGAWLFWPSQPAEAEPAPAQAVQPANVVSAEAFIVPVKESDLAFEVGGQVHSLAVAEGETVKDGQVLAELANTTQQAALAKAEASLAEAEAKLAEVQAEATPEEMAQTEASLAKAEAALAELVAGPTAETIVEAEARVATAQAELAQVLAGSRDEDIQSASARLLQAEAEVRLKQADYDKFVYGDPQVAEPYGVALQKATLDYEAAQADYDKLVSGATEEAIAVARAQLNEEVVALDKVKAGTRTEQIAQFQADVQKAQAALAELKAGATTEEIAVAEAGIQIALAGLQSAQADLAKTQLTAPFAGMVGAVNTDEGEMVEAGAAVLALGDISQWQVETDDLTEIDVVRVREGARVEISVDALPDATFEGRVIRITPKSETKAGDVTYTVLIEITAGDTEALRWGMTTFVDIEVEPEL